MSRSAVSICKFVGTISLGLLTGQSLTNSGLVLPSLLSSPSPSSAQKPFATLKALSTRQTALLSTISSAALLIAYTLSPSRLRHPYLLYATFAIGAGWSFELKDYYVTARDKNSGTATSAKGKANKETSDPSASISASTVVMGRPGEANSSSDEEWDMENSTIAGETMTGGSSKALNGEAVKEGIQQWSKRMGWKSVIWGLSWAVSVIGLWGETAC